MKRSALLTLISLVMFGPIGRTQTVTGSGTPGTLPIFTGSSVIGNSPILQLGGSTSIGAMNERLGTKFQVITDSITSAQPGQGPAAIYAEATGSADFTVGVFGLASSGSGGQMGVAGIAYSPAGVGVSGTGGNGGGGGGGVIGHTDANSGYAFGVRGDAVGTSGAVIGVQGITNSPQGDGGRFVGVKGTSGTILRGDTGPAGAGTEVTVFRVDGNGTIFADGGFRPFGADFAESVAVNGSADHYVPGDLLAIDVSGERRLSLSQSPYSTLVAGIYSTQPGVIASQHRVEEALPKNEVPLAVVGIVPCKVTTENGPIVAGDLLVTSSTPGHAIKGTDRGRMLGAVVGKALEPLQKETGVIQVLVTLQ